MARIRESVGRTGKVSEVKCDLMTVVMLRWKISVQTRWTALQAPSRDVWKTELRR